MGNAVSAANPTEILPVEHYLTDLGSNFESLGSTRFMKVARGRTSESVNVYKVFLIQDDRTPNEAINLDPFGKEVNRIRDSLAKAPNCAPFREIYQKPRSVVLVRSCQKYTLSDRLSTRPFMNQEERIWYIYQIFKALHQCQKANVCHGDIKSQNILISSYNWVQLSDFASFKPTYLPNDNPSHFTFFFDTSRKQVCNLAPERFLSSEEFDKKYRDKGEKWMFGTLNHAMDMFSAGCVVYEMLCEGKSPFNYGQLCEYSCMKHSEALGYLEKLSSDVPPQFRPLLKMLLNQEPKMRMTAQQVLEGTALQFPSILDFIFYYLNAFRPKESSSSQSIEELISTSPNDPDDVIGKLKRDENNLWMRLNECLQTRPFAVLFISLITANIRALRHSQTKVDAMNLLLKFATLCDTAVSTHRILPYLVYFLSDEQESVRAVAVHSIVDLTQPLEPSCFEDSLIFIDYLLPEFASILDRGMKSSSCMMALASNLGTIAQTAYNFLVVGRSLRAGVDDECSGVENLSDVQQMNDECRVLFKSVSDLFVTLCDADNNVRQALIQQHNLALLFNFLSKSGSGELLYHHMITFLNSKSDWRLRAAFFDALPICLQKSSVVQPLLYQGMHDYEELVILRVLHCISLLSSAEMLDQHSIVQILECASSFLAHPNPWIRFEVINLLVLLDNRWSIADNYCKVLPFVRDYFNGKGLLRFNHKVTAFFNLKSPIPRSQWKSVMENLKDIEVGQFQAKLYDYLTKMTPLVWEGGRKWFAKHFESQEINADILKAWRRFDLRKLIDSRKLDGMEIHLTRQRTCIDLSSDACRDVTRRNYPLRRKGVSHSTVYEEWYYGPNGNERKLIDINKSYMRNSLCGNQLQELLEYKQSMYILAGGPSYSAKEIKEAKEGKESSISGTSKNQIMLITHLHEHTDAVTQMALHHSQPVFASASRDGTVKIWSVKAVIGESCGAITSRDTFPQPFGKKEKNGDSALPPIEGVGWTSRGELGIAASNSTFSWNDVTSDFREISKVRFTEADGPPKQIHVDDNLVFVRTHHNTIYCLDSRIGDSNGPLGRHEAWRRDISKLHGLITSFCIDPWQANWMVLTCTNYRLILWDVRFQMEVSSRAAHDRYIPSKIWSNVRSSYQSPEVFVQTQHHGEISVFDLSQPMSPRSRVLWPSSGKPLKYDRADDDIRNITTALTVCEKTGAVFTGDAQGALRRWYPNSAYDCLYLNGPRFIQDRSPYRTYFTESVVDNNVVIHEVKTPNTQQSTLRHIPPIEYKAVSCHRTPITDLMVVENEYLVSSSSEGIIKIWK